MLMPCRDVSLSQAARDLVRDARHRGVRLSHTVHPSQRGTEPADRRRARQGTPPVACRAEIRDRGAMGQHRACPSGAGGRSRPTSPARKSEKPPTERNPCSMIQRAAQTSQVSTWPTRSLSIWSNARNSVRGSMPSSATSASATGLGWPSLRALSAAGPAAVRARSTSCQKLRCPSQRASATQVCQPARRSLTAPISDLPGLEVLG